MKLKSTVLRYLVGGAAVLGSYAGLVTWDHSMELAAARDSLAVIKARDLVRDRIAQRFRERELAAILEGKASGFELPLSPLQFEAGALRQIAEASGVAPLSAQPSSDLMLCHDGKEQIRYRSDRFGFRNADSVWDTDTEIALIGGAPMQGACVEDAATVSGNLISRGISAVNLGVSNAGPTQYAAIAKTFLPVLRPKVVVLALHPTDAAARQASLYEKLFFDVKPPPYFTDARVGNLPLDLSLELKLVYDTGRRILPYPGADARGMNARSAAANPTYAVDSDWSSSLALKRVSNRLHQRFLGTKLPDSTRAAIDAVDAFCLETGCRAMYLAWPPNPTWIPQPSAKDYTQAIQDHVRRLGRGTFLDLEAVASDSASPFFVEGDEFYTDAGYAIAAKMIQQHAPPTQ